MNERNVKFDIFLFLDKQKTKTKKRKHNEIGLTIKGEIYIYTENAII